MAKKLIVVLILVLFAIGAVFADETENESEINNSDNYFPRHTITADVFWTGISYYVTLFTNETFALNNYFVWTSLQYEYQIIEKISVAARLDIRYMDFNYEMRVTSAEGIFRFYPTGDTFNINATAGYTHYAGYSYYTETNFTEHLLSIGSRLAWRIDFGKNKPGGMILEPYIGYRNIFGSENFNKLPDSYLIQTYIAGGLHAGLGLGYRF